MNTNVFIDALQEATTRLAEVEVRFEALRKKKDRLQDLVANLNAVIDDEDTPRVETIPIATVPTISTEHVRAGDGKTWRLAQAVLSKHGPLPVPKIYKRMFELTSNPPSKDSIRVAMLRKPEAFTNNEGVFSIIHPAHHGENSHQTGELQWKEATEVAS